MRVVPFKIKRAILTPQHDTAVILGDEDVATEVVDGIISAISTDIEITVAGIETHLAMWLDPAHWADDWREAGIEDFDEWAEGLVVEK